MLLHASFGSLGLAVLAIVTLPMALVGGDLAAWLGDGVISLGSLVGFFTVMGIASADLPRPRCSTFRGALALPAFRPACGDGRRGMTWDPPRLTRLRHPRRVRLAVMALRGMGPPRQGCRLRFLRTGAFTSFTLGVKGRTWEVSST
ncbi:MAG: hypothetical protein ACRDO0_00320 [Nocardioidaceae bacterium]